MQSIIGLLWILSATEDMEIQLVAQHVFIIFAFQVFHLFLLNCWYFLNPVFVPNTWTTLLSTFNCLIRNNAYRILIIWIFAVIFYLRLSYVVIVDFRMVTLVVLLHIVDSCIEYSHRIIMMLFVRCKFIDLLVCVPLDYVIFVIDGTWIFFSLIYLVKKHKSNWI